MKILILCTGNTCRSQMAEGFFRERYIDYEIFSAGTHPERTVNPYAVKVMSEFGIDISKQIPENVEKYINESFDYVITVCDDAKEKCPVFTGKVGKQIHKGFEDPAKATGTEEEQLVIYRKIRNQIEEKLRIME